jgi:hypothetical protein
VAWVWLEEERRLAGRGANGVVDDRYDGGLVLVNVMKLRRTLPRVSLLWCCLETIGVVLSEAEATTRMQRDTIDGIGRLSYHSHG